MAKPPPTRTTSRAPASVAPVRTLAKADRKPASETASASIPVAKRAVQKPARVLAKPRDESLKADNALTDASPEKPAAKPDTARAASVAAKTAPIKNGAGARAPSAASHTPADPSKAPTRTAPRSAAVKSTPAAPNAAAAIAEAATAAAKETAGVVAASMDAAKAATSPPPTAAAAKPASLGQLPPPRLPEVATLTGETVMSQALTMARAFGALQAKMVEHACAEFQATVGDAEQLARSDSASEAIALQAKAVRRSYESYAEHLKELARIASGTLKKG